MTIDLIKEINLKEFNSMKRNINCSRHYVITIKKLIEKNKILVVVENTHSIPVRCYSFHIKNTSIRSVYRDIYFQLLKDGYIF